MQNKARQCLQQMTNNPLASFHDGQYESINELVTNSSKMLVVQKTGWGKHLDDEHFEFIMHRLNNRPRKTLGMKTPNEVLFEELQAVALAS